MKFKQYNDNNLWSVRMLLPPSFSGPLIPASGCCNLYESQNLLFQYLASTISMVAFRTRWVWWSVGEEDWASQGREGGRRSLLVCSLTLRRLSCDQGKQKSVWMNNVADLPAVATSGGQSVCKPLPTPCVLNSYASWVQGNNLQELVSVILIVL